MLVPELNKHMSEPQKGGQQLYTCREKEVRVCVKFNDPPWVRPLPQLARLLGLGQSLQFYGAFSMDSLGE